ncbi:hypothetical protein JG687_00015944 [Phytophthora cactorum]|uniref:Uncharacterized protein n=1 Tax=Phytophthora cactorum TaxID=29920 RepID=A0A8T1TUY8_9STRA|nr:hypothetical protein PC123_g14942 [Phytophthora cactorum]KAG6947698.1 hypothetical protein JG687_00015944 [Phytophthora cactorum]
MIQASLNHTAVSSLGNRAPVELFTGLPRPTPLKDFYLPGQNELQTVPESDKVEGYLEKLRCIIQQTHGAVEDQRTKQRLLNQKRQRGDNLINFHVGDYVLRSRVDEKHGNKLQVTWVGPYRVVRADTHSFRVQHLVTGDEVDVHESRLKMYADSSLNVTDDTAGARGRTRNCPCCRPARRPQVECCNQRFRIVSGMEGVLQLIEDSYEPMSSLAKEIRVLVGRYVDQAADEQLTEYLRKVQKDSGLSAVEQSAAETADPVAGVPGTPEGETPSTERRQPGNKRMRRQRDGASRRKKSRVSVDDSNSTGTTTVFVPTAYEGEEHKTDDDQNCSTLPGRRSKPRTAAAPTVASEDGSKQRLRRSSRTRKDRGQRD